MASPQKYNPNPNYGTIPLRDIPSLIVTLLVRLPIALTYNCVYRFFYRDHLSFTEFFQRAAFRNVLRFVPRSVLRRPVPFDQIATSPRFAPISASLNQRVERPSFAGNWLCTTHNSIAGDPAASDIIIFYLHGGGYVQAQPNNYALILLRLMETVVCAGKSISIFVLDYSLAPEFAFPTQLQQTEAAYEYLVLERGIEPGRIVLMGDSAGGSIALSFLMHLRQPLDGVVVPPAGTTQIRGVCLLSPWIAVGKMQVPRTKGSSDILNNECLAAYTEELFRHSTATYKEKAGMYTDFSTRHLERVSWSSILPRKVWVCCGGDELFGSDIHGFVDAAREDGVDVGFHEEPGQFHVWQLGEAFKNGERYLAHPFGVADVGVLPGSERIGQVVLSFLE